MEAQSAEARHNRVQAIDRLHKKGGVVFASIDTLLFKMLPPEKIFAQYIVLKEGAEISPQKLLNRLAKAGYEYAPLIESVGQISGRGEMVEVFAPGLAQPLRITFFDEEIESVRAFDTDSQRSFGGNLGEVNIPPAHELLLEHRKQRKCWNTPAIRRRLSWKGFGKLSAFVGRKWKFFQY